MKETFKEYCDRIELETCEDNCVPGEDGYTCQKCGWVTLAFQCGGPNPGQILTAIDEVSDGSGQNVGTDR